MSGACRNIRFIASAGTGKTYQVVSLYQSLLLGRPYPRDDTSLPGIAAGGIFDGGQRIPPDRILMLTFTRNAAAEMRSRVTEAIERELATGDPDNEAFCWSLLRRLSGATISTIHAFAQQLLARHTLELGLSPSLRVLEEPEAAALRREAAQAALRLALTRDNPAYVRDIEQLCDGHGVEAILAGILQTIRQCSIWAIDLENAEPASLVLKPNEPRLLDLQSLMRPLQEKADANGGKSIGAMAASLRAALHRLGAAPTPEAMAASARALRDGMGSGKWGNDDLAKEFRLRVKTTLESLADYPLRVEAARLLTSFLTLARDGARGIQIGKREQGVLDFDDLLVRACALIRGNPGAVPPTDVIIVDEAQDNSRLQNELILLVQNATQAAIAACGDTKQTIYGWRGADPGGLERFAQTLKLTSVPLRTSYRSQKGILEWVNDIFAGVVLGPELYGENEELLPCPAAETSRGPAVELLLPDWEALPSPQDEITVPGRKTRTGEGASATCPRIALKKSDLDKLAETGSTSGATDWGKAAGLAEQSLASEARAVARRIRLLTSPAAGGHWHPPRVWDSSTQLWIAPRGQPYRFRDILILLRATTRQELYEQALQEEHIPFTTDGAGRGFFVRQEIQDLSNLLSWLAFPFDRQALLGLLRSPFCALSDNAVAILSADPAAPSLRSLVTVVGDQAKAIAADLQRRSLLKDAAAFLRIAPILRRLCALAGRVSAVDLVREAVRLTGYDAILAGTFHGVQRLANLQKLLSWIQELERSENLDGQAVAMRLATEISSGREAPDAAVLDPDDDSVRINTVHAAKGLSSPVVIVPDLRRKPRHDASWIHVVRDEEGHGATLAARLKFYDDNDEFQDKVETEGYDREVDRNKVERDQESRRLFYVATTRARDLLIFSAENPTAGGDETWRAWINRHLFACAFKPGLVRLRPYGEIETAWRALGQTPAVDYRVSSEQLADANVLCASVRFPERYRFPVTALVRPTSLVQLGSVSVTPKFADNRESDTGTSPPEEDNDALGSDKSGLGALAHRLLETLDYSSATSLDRQIEQAPELRDIAAGERKTIMLPVRAAANAMAGLLKGVAPEDIIREMPFAALFEQDGAQVIVDGKVDMIFFKGGAWHIVDYKFSAHAAGELAGRYALQLAVYREALSKSDAAGHWRVPRFETAHKTPAPFTLMLLGVNREGTCASVDVNGRTRADIAAHLITTARRLSGCDVSAPRLQFEE